MKIISFCKSNFRLIFCVILFLVLTSLLTFLALNFVPDDISEGDQLFCQEYVLKKSIFSLAIFGMITFLFFIFRYLFENTRETFFFGLLGIILPVIISAETTKQIIEFYYSLYRPIDHFFWFAVALSAYLGLLCTLFGFYPISAKVLIKAMRRQLLYHEGRNGDWIREGERYYPLQVIQTNHVPQNLDFLSNVNLKSLDKEIDLFIQKAASRTKRQKAFLLVGGLGTGKSTALFRAAEKHLKSSPFHHGTIPVYIKLREWLADSDLEIIEFSGARNLTLEQYNTHIEKICNLVAANTSKADYDQVTKNHLFTLHEKQRLVYIFDGLNELVMRHSVVNQQQEQFVHDLMVFLHHFSGGNSYILSTCNMEHIITSRSLLIDKENCDYQIFAVKGIDLEKVEKQAKKNDKKTDVAAYSHLSTNVSLYRLARNKKEPDCIQFEVLHHYVNQQLHNELVSLKDEQEYLNTLVEIIEETITKKNRKKVIYQNDDPYVPLIIPQNCDQRKLRVFQNANLLIKETKDGKSEYHPKHAMIYQYLLAAYAVEAFWGKKATKPNTAAFISFFHVNNGDSPMQLLSSPVLRKVFSILISQIVSDENAPLEYSKTYLTYLYNSIKETEDKLDFLLLLSFIHDELERVNKTSAEKFRNLLKATDDSIIYKDLIKTINLTKSDNAHKEAMLHVRFALIRLSGIAKDAMTNDENKAILKALLTDSLNKPWVHLPLKRGIVRYILAHNSEILSKDSITFETSKTSNTQTAYI